MQVSLLVGRRRAARAAATEGRLEAAASNNPFAAGKIDVAVSATADEAEAAAEAAAVALLAAERFAALLASNAERLGPHAGLKVCQGIPLAILIVFAFLSIYNSKTSMQLAVLRRVHLL